MDHHRRGLWCDCPSHCLCGCGEANLWQWQHGYAHLCVPIKVCRQAAVQFLHQDHQVKWGAEGSSKEHAKAQEVGCFLVAPFPLLSFLSVFLLWPAFPPSYSQYPSSSAQYCRVHLTWMTVIKRLFVFHVYLLRYSGTLCTASSSSFSSPWWRALQC